jgi:hypothetical protein
MPKRALQICLLVITAFTMLGAGTPAKRFDKLGHLLMCPCGCAEILLECNHVGCPDSSRLIAELHTQVGDVPGLPPSEGTPTPTAASILPDAAIFSFFSTKYGPTVLAAPIRGGFDNLAWIMPFVILVLGLFAVIAVVRLWRLRNARLTPAVVAAPSPAEDALRDRIRNETNYGE